MAYKQKDTKEMFGKNKKDAKAVAAKINEREKLLVKTEKRDYTVSTFRKRSVL